jgi:hypothetical protein
MPTPKMPSHVRDAAECNLPKCPRCFAWRGDPCRTPSDHTRKPHKERLADATPNSTRELFVEAARRISQSYCCRRRDGNERHVVPLKAAVEAFADSECSTSGPCWSTYYKLPASKRSGREKAHAVCRAALLKEVGIDE